MIQNLKFENTIEYKEGFNNSYLLHFFCLMGSLTEKSNNDLALNNVRICHNFVPIGTKVEFDLAFSLHFSSR